MPITENLVGGAFSGAFDVAALIVVVAIVALLVTSKETANVIKALGEMFGNAITSAKSG